MSNLIQNIAASNSSVLIDKVDIEMSPLVGDHVGLHISSVIVPKCYHVNSVSNKPDDDKGLAKLIVSKEVREFLLSSSKDEVKIAEVLDLCCVTKNSNVRLQSPVSDFYLISNAVHKVFPRIDVVQRTTLSIFLYRALTKWGLIAIDRRASIILHEKAEELTEGIFNSEIMLDQAYRICSQLHFRSIMSDKGYTNTKVLSALFCESIMEIAPQLENLSRFSTALQSVLSRVYSFITKQVAEFFAPDERFFVEDANFKFLASNLGIINMAIELKQPRPTSNIVFWKEHDAIIYDALMGNKLFSVIPLPKYRDMFIISRLVSSRGKLSGVIISKMLKNDDSYSTYFMHTINGFTEYSTFSLGAEHDSLMNVLLKSFSSESAHSNVSQLIESVISDDISQLFIAIGVSGEQELMNLAACLSDRVMINTKTGLLTYTKTLDKSRSNLRFSDFLPDYVVTDSERTLLFAASFDYVGKDYFDSSVGEQPEYKTKYTNGHIITSTDVENRYEIKLPYSYDILSNTLKSWSLETSYKDLLRLDITTPIVTSRIELLAAAIRRMLNVSKILENKRYMLAGIGDKEISSRDKKKLDDVTRAAYDSILEQSGTVDYVVQVRAATFVDTLMKVAYSNSYFNAISHNLLSQFVTYVRQNKAKFSNLKAGNIFSDEVLKELFRSGCITALLRLSGVFSYKDGEEDYDYLTMLLARRSILLNA